MLVLVTLIADFLTSPGKLSPFASIFERINRRHVIFTIVHYDIPNVFLSKEISPNYSPQGDIGAKIENSRIFKKLDKIT